MRAGRGRLLLSRVLRAQSPCRRDGTCGCPQAALTGCAHPAKARRGVAAAGTSCNNPIGRATAPGDLELPNFWRPPCGLETPRLSGPFVDLEHLHRFCVYSFMVNLPARPVKGIKIRCQLFRCQLHPTLTFRRRASTNSGGPSKHEVGCNWMTSNVPHLEIVLCIEHVPAS